MNQPTPSDLDLMDKFLVLLRQSQQQNLTEEERLEIDMHVNDITVYIRTRVDTIPKPE